VKLDPGLAAVPFGHLGDATSTTMSSSRSRNTADFMNRWHEVNKVVFRHRAAHGRLDLGEHGIGVPQARRAARRQGQDRDRADALPSKAMLDPTAS